MVSTTNEPALKKGKERKDSKEERNQEQRSFKTKKYQMIHYEYSRTISTM